MNPFKIGLVVNNVLVNDTPVSDIVGDKVFPNAIPDKYKGQQVKFPVIVYTKTTVQNDMTKECDVKQPLVILECWSESYDEATDLAEKVYNALKGFRGEVLGVRVSECMFTDLAEASDDGIYLQILTFKFR